MLQVKVRERQPDRNTPYAGSYQSAFQRDTCRLELIRRNPPPFVRQLPSPVVSDHPRGALEIHLERPLAYPAGECSKRCAEESQVSDAKEFIEEEVGVNARLVAFDVQGPGNVGQASASVTGGHEILLVDHWRRQCIEQHGP